MRLEKNKKNEIKNTVEERNREISQNIDGVEKIFLVNQEKTEVVSETSMETSDMKTDGIKYLFGFEKKEVQETDREIKERLQECGVKDIQLEGVREKYQEMIASSVEQMCESYPELKGYINSIRVADLESRTFACAGPTMTSEGFQTQILVNREAFENKGLESRIERYELPNWKGESWFAGEGYDAILKHEMAHLLHLQMIAKEEGLALGERNRIKFWEVQKRYDRNAIVTKICYETMQEQHIEPKELAAAISVYGAHDMGECFAEAMSEYETRKHPRPFAVAVHEKYERRKQEYDNTTT